MSNSICIFVYLYFLLTIIRTESILEMQTSITKAFDRVSSPEKKLLTQSAKEFMNKRFVKFSTCCDKHLMGVIVNALGNDLKYEWADLVFSMVKKAIKKVSCSAKDKKDVREHIKVKTVKADVEKKLLFFVHGVVLENNVEHKRMKDSVKNPR